MPAMTTHVRIKHLVLVFAAIAPAVLTVARAAEPDPVAWAMKLYVAHHYSEAAVVLRAALPTLGAGQQAMGDLALGMVYTKNAALHRELARAAALAQLDYLERLVHERGRDASHVAPLYLGETLLVLDRPREAANVLEKLVAQHSTPTRQRMLARTDLGLCYERMHESQKAGAQWNGLDSADPEIRMALAASYGRAGMRQAKGTAKSALRAAGNKQSERLLGSLLSVYAHNGEVDKALQILPRLDLKAPVYTEVLGKSKMLSFYSPYLLGDLAQLYDHAGVVYLEKAARDTRLKGTAEYYLGEAYAQAGNPERAANALDDFLVLPQSPPQYRDRARVHRATVDYLLGRRTQALGEWNVLTRQQPVDTDLLAGVVLACRSVGADCPQIVTHAAMTADAGQGRRYAALDAALGRYYLQERNYPKAIWYMEAARDKGNKNKIEANDPVMLVDLGLAYYQTMQYSENLEIYFEMSKEFPEVRQIQDAVQGVYVMVQQSAGDVKIF